MDQLIRSMLEQEVANARKQDLEAAGQRSPQVAAALSAQHEQQKREYEAKKNELAQQQQASTEATLRDERTQNWGTQPIGEYQSIEPVAPRRRFFGFGGASK